MKVSIIIPTFNYAYCILTAIRSLLQQEYPENLVEIIVIDDGSTDDTKRVLERHIQSGTIQYFYQQNAGKAAATRMGILKATGGIICNLDADDTFLTGKLKTIVQLFEDYPNLSHFGSPALIQWPGKERPDETEPIPAKITGRLIPGFELLKYFINHKMLFGGGSTFCVRAGIIKGIEIPPSVDMYIDEWLVIQALLSGDSYLFAEPLSTWQVHGANYSVRMQSHQDLAAKHQRLEASSRAILSELESRAYPDWLVKSYKMKHEVRKMGWKEKAGCKSLKDRLHFAVFCLLQNSFPIRWWVSYRLINRILL